MKRIEITFNKYQKELERLNVQLERTKTIYTKKFEIAKKFGVENWTSDDRYEWSQTVETTESGFFVNKADEKKNMAWFDMWCAKQEITRKEQEIERAEKRLEKADIEIQKYYDEINHIADLKEREKLMKESFEKEQKEWLKDGIKLESRYTGITPNGKGFAIYGNQGFTIRSMHCFTLYIQDKGVIFTSGEFWRAYQVIKNS